jgi:ATP-dependent helicase/nuclease subunit A
MDARVRQTLGMPADADEDWAVEPLDPDLFPDDHPDGDAAAARSVEGQDRAGMLAFMREWLELDGIAGDVRQQFRKTMLKADGTPSARWKKPRELDPDFAEIRKSSPRPSPA